MGEKNYKYTKEHEWVKIEGDVAIVGITNHAQEALGDITFVEIPEIGTAFSCGDQTGSIESVKAVSEIYAPLSGEVVEVNDVLSDSPEFVNQDPYHKGWIFKIKISNDSEVANLLDFEAYSELLESEG